MIFFMDCVGMYIYTTFKGGRKGLLFCLHLLINLFAFFSFLFSCVLFFSLFSSSSFTYMIYSDLIHEALKIKIIMCVDLVAFRY